MKAGPQILAVLAAVTLSAAAESIVDQVPASLLATPEKTNTTATARDIIALPARKQPVTPGDRWAKFEAEFGITNKESSPVKSTLQSAKYQLDHTTFAVQEFVNNVENLLRFDYSVRDLMTSSSTPKIHRGSTGSVWLDTFNEMRVRSDIDLKLSSRQFVGVKLVLPLGD